MQPMQEPPPRVVAERSRRRPPRQRTTEPIPIPEPAAPARPKTVRLQDVLAAHQRAIEERIEEGLRQMREIAAEVTLRAATEVAEAARPPQGTDQTDLARGALAFADERFQAIRLRLERIEEALRRLAVARRAGPEKDRRAEATASLAGSIGALAREQQAALARLAEAQQRALAGLADAHRAAVEDLARRTGRGVVAVARVLQRDIEGIKTSVRSMHRTLAWEGTSGGLRRHHVAADDPS
jgi:hypothetical protein